MRSRELYIIFVTNREKLNTGEKSLFENTCWKRKRERLRAATFWPPHEQRPLLLVGL